jgi:hypothetical protein
MIKNIDLKKGNLIKTANPITKEIETCIVYEIKKNVIVVKDSSGSQFGVDIIDVCGIGITPDLLVKNGFKIDKVKRAILKISDDEDLVLDPKNEVKHMNDPNEWELYRHPQEVYKHLHELQNLLSSKYNINMSNT